MSSQKKIDANRRNAARSTGPRTPEGKERSSQNAITHGVFSPRIVLHGESHAAFEVLRRQYIRELRPQSMLELSLVEEIAQAQWRLIRLQSAEGWLYASKSDAVQAQCGRHARRMAGAMQSGCDEAMIEEMDEQELDEQQQLCLAVKKTTSFPADVCLAMMLNADDGAIERHGRYEQRMQRTIHRCLGELRQHRKEQGKTLRDLPDSPFIDDSPIPPDPEPQEPDEDEDENENDDEDVEDGSDFDENEPTDEEDQPAANTAQESPTRRKDENDRNEPNERPAAPGRDAQDPSPSDLPPEFGGHDCT